MKRLFCIFLCLVLCLPVLAEDLPVSQGCATLDGAMSRESGEDFPLDARAAFVYEVNTGTILYTADPDSRQYPASLTKLLTALVVLDRGTLEDEILMTESALATLDWDSSRADLKVGTLYTTQQLLYALLLPSGNDAAALLAEFYGGSFEGFAQLMNEKAQSLGCTGSHFVTPHGLHHEDHYSTARDLAKIFLACVEDERIMTVLQVPSYQVTEELTWYSSNFFINDHLLPDLWDTRILGGKTGFTRAAGRCLAVVSQVGNRKLLSVVLGTPEEGEWMEGKFTHFTETARLLDHLYEGYTNVPVLTAGEVCQELSVQEQRVMACSAGDLLASLSTQWTPEELTFTFTTLENLALPIAAGDPVGQVQVWYRGTCLGIRELVAQEDVLPPTEPPTEPPTTAPTEPPAQPPTEAPTQAQPEPEPPESLPNWVWMIPVGGAVLAAGAIERLVSKAKKQEDHL